MAKRSNGEGSIRHRPDGRWELRIMDEFLEDSRRNIIYFYGKNPEGGSRKGESLSEFTQLRNQQYGQAHL